MTRIILLLLWATVAVAQSSPLGTISGRVTSIEQGETIALPYASLQWTNGEGTTSDSTGHFTIDLPKNNDHQLVVSYLGYRTDTLTYTNQDPWIISLVADNLLAEATVSHRKKGTEISTINPIKTEMLGVKELRKAACCNLSESFETNPSVDVSFSDAVTGTKQIKMLGLAGRYSLVTRESMPVMRGYAGLYGLAFVPGTWVEGIQISKGAGTVVNGYESMSGQINIELLKPNEKPPILLNLFANQGGRLEANVHLNKQISKKLSTLVLLHGNLRKLENDRNNDGFLDIPLDEQINVLNRWKWSGDELRTQIGFHYVNDTKDAGQFSKNINDYKVHLETQKLDAWGKIGYLFPQNVNQSIGLQFAAVSFDQKGNYGHRLQKVTQKSLYANLIFESIIGNTNHKYKLGASIVNDDIKESLDTLQYNQERIIPGIYGEYTWTPAHNLTVVAGLRNDWLKNKMITSPRVHVRLELTEKTIARLSAGKGMRHGLLLGDRAGLAATSRVWQLESSALNEPEITWNYGVNLTHNFKLDYRDGYVSFDFYRTDFIHKIVTDIETFGFAKIYALDGQSYSNSFQGELSYEIVKRLDAKVAYRFFDIKTKYKDKQLINNPLSARRRGFLNLGYETRKGNKNLGWTFDVTTQWVGEKRIPSTNGLSPTGTTSPSYFQLHGQVTAKIGKKLQVYIGGDNLLDFRQNTPIIGSDQPFGQDFDSSLVWGPIFGRGFYVGMRM